MALDAAQAARVDAAVREVTDAEALKKRARAHGGWDSHTLVQVIFAIEEAFGLVFSSIMVEMVETATILHQASDRSLVILDEIGRGTATFDGLSIAWAVIERRLSGRAP